MDTSLLLQTLLNDFQDKMQRLDDLIKRDIQFPHAPKKIKVAIGMRRSGKTYKKLRSFLIMALL